MEVILMRIPNHIAVIPDGNRRWAQSKGLLKQEGYSYGLDPGVQLLHLCHEYQVEELTYYGFTMDNTKRPPEQTTAFRKACVEAVEKITRENASLLVVGNTNSPMFPEDLLPFTKERITFGDGSIKVNFLVNYGWQWDLSNFSMNNNIRKANVTDYLYSKDISRIALVIRWGGRRRLSGLLPVQSIYADFYVIEDYWPDFKPHHFHEALEWYDKQDITLGG